MPVDEQNKTGYHGGTTNMTDSRTPQQIREEVAHKTFVMAFRILIYLLVPALIALFAGKKVDEMQGTGRMWTLIFLGCSFVFSWTLIIRQYLTLRKDLLMLNDLPDTDDDSDNNSDK